jgi:hypothetical protein
MHVSFSVVFVVSSKKKAFHSFNKSNVAMAAFFASPPLIEIS